MFPSGFTNLLPLALSFAPFAARWGDAPVSSTVQLDQATVYGTTNGSVTSYLGIPFAEPPVGDLRLRLPKPIESYNGTIDATQVGPRCFQLFKLPPLRTEMPAELLQDVVAALTALSPVEIQPESEDCLNLNARQMLLVLDGEDPMAIERDAAQEEAIEFVRALSLKYPL